jgi:ribose/xylose/arabinose/galactoside ABC-type transport system permease subunit
MMGTNQPSDIAYKIRLMGFEEDLNRKDGSFLAAKMISEFGVLAILLITYYFVTLVKRFNFYSIQNSMQEINKKNRMLCSIALSLMLEIFVRGGDYFSSQILIGVSSYLLLIIGDDRYEQKN